jgi:hypothetical protein
VSVLLFSDDVDDIDFTDCINTSYHILLLCRYMDSIDSNKKYIKIQPGAIFSLRLQVLGYSDCVPLSYENLMFQCYQKFYHIYYSVVP